MLLSIFPIFLSNHSFDNYFGTFPGADGLANAGATATQVDKQGRPYVTLPPPLANPKEGRRSPDPRFPGDLPNRPFLFNQFVPPTELTANQIHSFYRNQYQINGGKMDQFVAWTDAGGMVMGYWDLSGLPLYKLAQEYTIAGRPHARFQFNHQPFVFFAAYGDGTAAKREHLKDETEFLAALQDGTLPAVSFVKPIGLDNEHPLYATVRRGQEHVAELVHAVQASRYWNEVAIIITYDDNGGYWDHVPPPVIDRWGPGPRVPTVIVSRWAKRGYIDHTTYDTTSILKFIETRWNLTPLGTRDTAAKNLTNAFTVPAARR